jgi:hypothetical protein
MDPRRRALCVSLPAVDWLIADRGYDAFSGPRGKSLSGEAESGTSGGSCARMPLGQRFP